MKKLLERFGVQKVDDAADVSQIQIDDALLAKSKRVFEDESFVTFYQLNRTTVVKIGETVHMDEAENMRLASSRSVCPVPTIYQAYVDDAGRGVIVMDLMPGRRLDKIWDDLTQQNKDHIGSQLAEIMGSIHSIKGDYIGSPSKGRCLDPLFDEIEPRGPFADVKEFHDTMKLACCDHDGTGYGETIASFVNQIQETEVVFCHADFQPRNILIDDNYNVSAVLDWEYAGFYPKYWEYTKALYRPDWESDWIRSRAIDRIIEPRMTELSVMLHVRSILW